MPTTTPWYVYILYSITTGRTYTGITTAPCRRLQQHNSGVGGAKATRQGRPWMIVRIETYETRREASQREAAIKRMSKTAKLTLAGLAA